MIFSYPAFSYLQSLFAFLLGFYCFFCILCAHSVTVFISSLYLSSLVNLSLFPINFFSSYLYIPVFYRVRFLFHLFDLQLCWYHFRSFKRIVCCICLQLEHLKFLQFTLGIYSDVPVLIAARSKVWICGR